MSLFNRVKKSLTRPKIEPYAIPSGSEFSQEHELIGEFIKQARAASRHYYDIELKSFPAGQQILDADPYMARRYVMAAVDQTRHWDEMLERVRSQGADEMERMNVHHLPGWEKVWAKRIVTLAIVKALTRRKLPFEQADLLQLLQWCAAADHLSYSFPVGNIARALERFAKANDLDEAFVTALQKFARQLRSEHDKDIKRYATVVQQLIPGDTQPDEPDEPKGKTRPPPTPSLAGSPVVLTRLKTFLGLLPAQDQPTTVIGPDAFPIRGDSPLVEQHQLMNRVLREIIGTGEYYSPDPNNLKYGKQITHPPDESAASLYLAAAERQVQALLSPDADFADQAAWQSRYAAIGTIGMVRTRGIPWTRDETFDALLYLSTQRPESQPPAEQSINELIESAERYAKDTPLTEGERFALSRVRASLVAGPAFGMVSDQVQRLNALVEDGALFCLTPGEAWSDLVNQDYSKGSRPERENWNTLFGHMLAATTSRPSKKWLKTAAEALKPIREETLVACLQRWLPEVTRGRTVRQLGHYSGDTRGAADTMQDENATILRGLLWIIPTLKDRDQLARLVSEVTLSAYKKVPGVGPRAVKVGNAGVYALSQLGTTDAVGHLAVLKVRVKFGTAQKEIEKAFSKTAEALSLPRDEIEEMGVPSYGLSEVGRLSESVGDYQAEIVVTGSDAALSWCDGKGKRLKSVPAKVRSGHADQLKDLRQSLKDIKALLPAQRDRIDSMFLGQRTWPISAWRERYLDHPLVGTIARRLIWCVDGEPAMFLDGLPSAVDGSSIDHGATAEISLWHPVGEPVARVVAWRERLEQLQLTQPFKQAHREIYLLTAAEENTGTYSNRFAAHVIRQHQFNALCSARGWKNQLRLMVDDSYAPPSKELPEWNLRAEFWVEGIGEEYGTDTNESGSYLYLATDQVRFYRSGASQNWAHAGGGGYSSNAAGPGRENINDPLPLEQIPPLVLSEIMRDVDLFVGVASVGNDPNWQDGGPEGRYREYWSSYSFGELSATATTRKEVLERLVPRLKIADRCSFSDRFLMVKGEMRTYKIHLGSGNILMDPNDEYLCIVPDSRPKGTEADVYLPFEGDRTLSIILSKAFLLAADNKIKDATILQQIKR